MSITIPQGISTIYYTGPSDVSLDPYKDNINHYKEKYQNIKNTDRFKQRIECQCGRHYTENSKGNHFKSQVHKNYMLSILYINAE
jgi:hypothetical protein